jgi:hypothetical protein
MPRNRAKNHWREALRRQGESPEWQRSVAESIERLRAIAPGIQAALESLDRRLYDVPVIDPLAEPEKQRVFPNKERGDFIYLSKLEGKLTGKEIRAEIEKRGWVPIRSDQSLNYHLNSYCVFFDLPKPTHKRTPTKGN